MQAILSLISPFHLNQDTICSDAMLGSRGSDRMDKANELKPDPDNDTVCVSQSPVAAYAQ